MVTTRALGRRNHIERKVLALLRGESGGVAPGPAQDRRIAALRALAGLRGLTIMPPRTAYVCSDELLLLSWLAAAQRVAGPVRPLGANRELLTALLCCADELEVMGLRLTPLTLYSARLQPPLRASRPAERIA